MTTIRVRLLGDVAVEREGAPTPPGSVALRTVLALLALRPGEPVHGGTLIAQLWPGDDAPRHPAATLHTRITRLRGWLGGADRVTAHAGAYTLRVVPDAVDLARFLAAGEEALRVGASPDAALLAADTALRTWRGTPLPGLDAPLLDVARDHALERRGRVEERRARALIDLGRAPEAVEALGALIAANPVREPLRALLVEALHRAGRPRDAVEAYLAARRDLDDELGVAPGEELRGAYQRVVDARSAPGETTAPPSRMVGREAVLARIVDTLTEDGRVVVVDGVAGIGKSVLLAAARHAARAAGAEVLAGAWQEDRTPMAAWFEALGRPPDWSTREAPGPWAYDRLATMADAGPVLLTLDDAHRADSASLGVLTLLARRRLRPGAVVLVAARSPDAACHPEWDAALDDLLRSDQTVRVPLDVLDADVVVDLAAGRLAHLGEAAAELARLVATRSGGHPLHAAALLDVLTGQPDCDAALVAVHGVPGHLRAMFTHQVSRLPARARSALEGLAVLAPIGLGDLAAVLDRRPLDLADDLRPAVDAGLALALPDRVVVRHDLMSDAVHDSVPPAARTELHRDRLARLTAADAGGVDPFVLLRHALGAAAVIPTVVLARARLGAAISAYERRALPEALALLDAAAPDLDGDVELAVHRGLVLGALGDADAADDTLDAALETALASCRDGDATDERSARLLLLAAVGDEPLGRPVTGDPRRLARVRRLEPLGLPPGARAELLTSTLREEFLGGTPRPDTVARCRALGDDACLPLVTRARARALEARMSLEEAVLADERLAVADDAHRLAGRTGDPLLVLDTTELLMTATLGSGRLDRARVLCAEMAEGAERWHRPRLVWADRLVGAALLLAEGDVDGADAAALGGLTRGQELGVPDAVQGYGVHLVVRHWLTGSADVLVDLVAGAADAAPGIAAWSAGAAVAAARAGDRERASRHLAEFHRRRVAVAGRLFDRPGLCLAVAAAADLGDRATAELVRTALPRDAEAVVLVGYGAAILGPATLFTGLAAAILGDEAGARADYATAGALAATLGWTPWADAATRLAAHLDDPDGVVPPLGLDLRGRR